MHITIDDYRHFSVIIWSTFIWQGFDLWQKEKFDKSKFLTALLSFNDIVYTAPLFAVSVIVHVLYEYVKFSIFLLKKF